MEYYDLAHIADLVVKRGKPYTRNAVASFCRRNNLGKKLGQQLFIPEDQVEAVIAAILEAKVGNPTFGAPRPVKKRAKKRKQ